MIILFFLLFPSLTGCWDSQEIDKRANVLAIGIDVANSKDQKKEDAIAHLKKRFPIPNREMIKLTAQIAIPGRIPLGPEQGGGSTQKPVLVIHVVGHTMDDALLNLQQEVANQIFLGHLRIIVINEKVARKGTRQLNDFLRRNPQIRRTANIVVSKEKAAEYMEIYPKLGRVPSLYLADAVDNLTALGKFPSSFIGLFWTIQSSKGQETYLPYLKLKGKTHVQLNGLAYFKGDRMVGNTSPLEIGVFMSVVGIKKGGYPAFSIVPGTNKVVMIGTKKRKTRIKVNLKDGKPHALIKIRYENEIDEKDNPHITIADSKTIKNIEKEFSKEVIVSIRKLIVNTQAAGSDIFGFGEHFRAKLPRYWNKNVKTKVAWERIYKDLSFDITVESHIHRVGMKTN
jgi:Ger(x)C family germination protein